MSKKTSCLLGILLTILIGTWLNWRLCCANKKTIVAQPDTTLKQYTIQDGKFTLNSDANFSFNTSHFKIVEPISENLKNAVLGLKTYFDENPSERISLTGHYTNGETNNSAYPNLGLARANAVKNYFVSQGFSSKKIDTQGALKNSMIADDNQVFFGPINYDLSARTGTVIAEEEALKAACEALKSNPLVLYFNTGEAQINLTAEQRQKIANISRCVDKLGVKALVVGHTDNTGNAANNITLGQNRADFAKNYLTQNGILSSNIDTSSKGPNEPIADNATKAGRAKNRRTVVTIN